MISIQNNRTFFQKRLLFFTLLVLSGLGISPAHALEIPRESDVKWGGFVDTYYTYDLNSLTTSERNYSHYPFTSQAARHNEFNINLGFLEFTAQSEQMRGRFAIQTGTSVPVGYSTTEGTSLSKIQEAYAGYHIAPGMWIDAGIFFSHIGFESWISRENWTYTRCLFTDQIPYFQTGVKISYDQNGPWAFELHLLNGWSSVFNTNPSRSLGLHADYRIHPKLTLTYNNFYGLISNDLPRLYQEVYATFTLTENWGLILSSEYGLQKLPSQNWASWGSAELVTRYQLTPTLSLAYRLETFIDPKGVIEQTSTPRGYTLSSTSFGFNSQLTPQLLWRGELRGYLAPDAIFKAHSQNSRHDASLTTSLSVSF